MVDIVYEKGDYYVSREPFGKSKWLGYAVYKNGITHATRTDTIGMAGKLGLEKAIEACDRRAINELSQ